MSCGIIEHFFVFVFEQINLSYDAFLVFAFGLLLQFLNTLDVWINIFKALKHFGIF